MTPKPSTREPLELAPGLHLTPEGAAWLPNEGVLAVADLHLGYEAHYREGGAMVPDHAPAEVLDRIQALLDRYHPDELVVNGDMKHAFSRQLLHEKRAVAQLEAIVHAAGVRLVPVRGNHDAHLEKMLQSPVVAEHRAGDVVFVHGHAPVKREGADHLVVGHEHPAITVRDAVGIGFRLPAALHHAAARVLILPALSPWAAGVDPLVRGFAGPNLQKLPPDAFEAYVCHEEHVFPFGTLEGLRRSRKIRKR